MTLQQGEELSKVEKLLRNEEARVEDLRATLAEEKTRADKLKEEMHQKIHAHENELDRRQAIIQKLEAGLLVVSRKNDSLMAGSCQTWMMLISLGFTVACVMPLASGTAAPYDLKWSTN